MFDEVTGCSWLEDITVFAGVVGEPVVLVPERVLVLLPAGEQVPDLGVLAEDVVHLH